MKSGELQRHLDTINAHGADLHMAYNKLCETPAHLIEQRQNAYSRIRGQAEAMEMALRDLLEFVQAVKIGVYYRKHEASEALYLSGAINGLGISEPKENESDD